MFVNKFLQKQKFLKYYIILLFKKFKKLYLINIKINYIKKDL